QPVLLVRAGDQPGARRQPHLPVGVPGRLRDAGDPRTAPVGAPLTGAASRGPRRVPRALPERDRADGVGARVGEALPLQEPTGEDLHHLAVADPDLLDLDEDVLTQGLRLGLTASRAQPPGL